MAYKIEGETCPVCKAYLFEEDDVVFCPICGAPHHRDCYAAIGRCGLAELHGTSQQYTPKSKDEEEAPKENGKAEAAEKCPRCGKEKVKDSLFCPYCGHDFAGHSAGGFHQNPVNMYPPFVDPYGGIPHDGSVTIDGESVEDVKKFVFTNTQRYIPLFCRQSKKNKSGWNWAAFLLPHCWLFFRKQYVAGAIALALMLLSAVCYMPLNADLNQLISSGGQVVKTQQEQFQLILSLMPQVPIYSIIVAFAGMVIGLATNIYFGLMGDWHYRRHTISTIKSIRTDTNILEKDEAFFKKGATSLWGFLLAYMAMEFIPQIIATFI